MRENCSGARALRGERSRRAAAALLLGGAAMPAWAAAAVTAASGAQPPPDNSNREIVIIAPPLFRDIQAERVLDEQAIASYGVSTIDDLLGELQLELGDEIDQPVVIVNGQRINDLSQIGALPVEVLRGIQVLPRGSGLRAGGTSNQRLINITLKRQARSATLTVAPKIATEGDWHGARGEAILTQVRGDRRMNLSLRVRDESTLLESDRGIIQTAPRLPFALSGNVIGFPGTAAEVDPLLSMIAGQIVTVAPVPSGANPSLADFAAGANDTASTDLGQFRSLRPKTRNYDLNGTYATRLSPWLTATGTLRLTRNVSNSLRGLPGALFVLSPANPASPFSTQVALAYYAREPLRYSTQRDSGEANATFDATFGGWAGNLNLRHSRSRDLSRIQRQNGSTIALEDSVNPFDSDLSALITLRNDRTVARSSLTLSDLTLTVPAIGLPAGDVQATLETRLGWNGLRSRSTFGSSGNSAFHRNEQSARGALEIPLTGGESSFMPALGETSASAEYSLIHFSDAGSIRRRTVGLTWEPRPLLRLHGVIDETEAPASIQTLGNPVIVNPDVRVFDALTGQTVDVTQITGGNPSIAPQKTTIRSISALLRLVPRLSLQLNAEYTDTDLRHFISVLPEASAAVMLAFPDRFIRDSAGVLTTVDLRPVNFDSHREKRLRWGFSLKAPIAGQPESKPAAPLGRGAARPASRGSQTYLQLTANHTMVFSDEIVIRPGLGFVDLLEGGAIGIGGGRVRHQVDGTASLNSAGLGARLGLTWRGPSTLVSRFNGTTDTLHFSPLLVLNLRAFADARRFIPRSHWAQNLRLSLNVLNVTNDRQKVRDSAGATPLQYQPGYRDPLGRTIELEVRKVF